MPKSEDPSQKYLRFMNLVSAIRSLPALDAVEERLLNGLAARWATGQKPTVMETLDSVADASAATVHRRLKTLLEKGLVAFVEDSQDSRIKYVEPTSAAKAYFAKLGQALDLAARKSA